VKHFYPFWFVFCAGWGYMFANFPDDPQLPRMEGSPGDIVTFIAISACAFGAIVYVALRFPPKPLESARFGIDLKPWDQPLGVLQFVGVTFLFVGLWAALFLLLDMGVRPDLATFILATSTSLLLGGLIGARVYRRMPGKP
jgi:hypothetical protein